MQSRQRHEKAEKCAIYLLGKPGGSTTTSLVAWFYGVKLRAKAKKCAKLSSFARDVIGKEFGSSGLFDSPLAGTVDARAHVQRINLTRLLNHWEKSMRALDPRGNFDYRAVRKLIKHEREFIYDLDDMAPLFRWKSRADKVAIWHLPSLRGFINIGLVYALTLDSGQKRTSERLRALVRASIRQKLGASIGNKEFAEEYTAREERFLRVKRAKLRKKYATPEERLFFHTQMFGDLAPTIHWKNSESGESGFYNLLEGNAIKADFIMFVAVRDAISDMLRIFE